MKYNKKQFIENVYFLAKARNIKIGDLESACGVSPGYLSRLRQGEKNIAPGADFLLSVAEQLSVTADAILTFDFSRASAEEIDLHDYLEKLIKETRSGKLTWREDLCGYLNTVPFDSKGRVMHPLFSNLPEMNRMEPVYHSMFRTAPDGLEPVATYFCGFPGEKNLYIVEVAVPGEYSDDNEPLTELDLVMTGRGILDPVPLCHTSLNVDTRLDEDLLHLMDAVEDAASLPHLTPEAKEIIRNYLDIDERSAHESGQQS